ncbi:MAG TPA: hypothetical protein VE152_10640 [Acidimicrobiales bacterium]|nr:hypothetical protein [Acidimicrobiales bacterium]
MADTVSSPVARSAVAPVGPTALVAGWAVPTRASGAALTLADCSALAKVLVLGDPSGAVASALGVGHGRARRVPEGFLVTGVRPGEWLVLAPPGEAEAVAAVVGAVETTSLVTTADLTHARTLLRLTGHGAPEVLAKVCAIDLADAVSPNGACFSSSVARVSCDLVRDDRPSVAGRDGAAAGPGASQVAGSEAVGEDGAIRSYLLHCDRSYGQYLFDSLLDAGAEHGIEGTCLSEKEI